MPIRGIGLDSGGRYSLLWGLVPASRGWQSPAEKARLLSLRGNHQQCSSARRPLIPGPEALAALMSREDTLSSTQASARWHRPLLDAASSVPWLPHAALASGLRVTAGRRCYLWPWKPRMACWAPKVGQPSTTTTSLMAGATRAVRGHRQGSGPRSGWLSLTSLSLQHQSPEIRLQASAATDIVSFFCYDFKIIHKEAIFICII